MTIIANERKIFHSSKYLHIYPAKHVLIMWKIRGKRAEETTKTEKTNLFLAYRIYIYAVYWSVFNSNKRPIYQVDNRGRNELKYIWIIEYFQVIPSIFYKLSSHKLLDMDNEIRRTHRRNERRHKTDSALQFNYRNKFSSNRYLLCNCYKREYYCVGIGVINFQ